MRAWQSQEDGHGQVPSGKELADLHSSFSKLLLDKEAGNR